jgi:predicted phage terminase large subunit-like protein
MQRLHEDDTSGVILKMGLPYVHLCIPMRFEPDRRCVTSIGWQDPRTEAGELMFPERFGEQQVRELEATLGTYGTAGQLQQRPSPRGGGMLKSSWLTYWHTVPPALDFRFVTADTAQKTSTQHDYSVLQCWGRSVAGKAVLLDQIRGKWEAPELITEARAFWLKHLHDGRPIMTKAPLRAMYVEDKVSGTGLIQTLRRESITVLPVQRTKDKQSRGYDAAPFIEAGNVVVPQDAPWLSDFLAEFSTFPNGAHDDQLDPLFDAIDLAQKLPSVKSQSVKVLPIMSRW